MLVWRERAWSRKQPVISCNLMIWESVVLMKQIWLLSPSTTIWLWETVDEGCGNFDYLVFFDLHRYRTVHEPLLFGLHWNAPAVAGIEPATFKSPAELRNCYTTAADFLLKQIRRWEYLLYVCDCDVIVRIRKVCHAISLNQGGQLRRRSIAAHVGANILSQ